MRRIGFHDRGGEIKEIKSILEPRAVFNNFRLRLVRALFKVERGKGKKQQLRKVSEVSVKALKFTGIPITEDVVDLLFTERIYEDVLGGECGF